MKNLQRQHDTAVANLLMLFVRRGGKGIAHLRQALPRLRHYLDEESDKLVRRGVPRPHAEAEVLARLFTDLELLKSGIPLRHLARLFIPLALRNISIAFFIYLWVGRFALPHDALIAALIAAAFIFMIYIASIYYAGPSLDQLQRYKYFGGGFGWITYSSKNNGKHVLDIIPRHVSNATIAGALFLAPEKMSKRARTQVSRAVRKSESALKAPAGIVCLVTVAFSVCALALTSNFQRLWLYLLVPVVLLGALVAIEPALRNHRPARDLLPALGFAGMALLIDPFAHLVWGDPWQGRAAFFILAGFAAAGLALAYARPTIPALLSSAFVPLVGVVAFFPLYDAATRPAVARTPVLPGAISGLGPTRSPAFPFGFHLFSTYDRLARIGRAGPDAVQIFGPESEFYIIDQWLPDGSVSVISHERVYAGDTLTAEHERLLRIHASGWVREILVQRQLSGLAWNPRADALVFAKPDWNPPEEFDPRETLFYRNLRSGEEVEIGRYISPQLIDWREDGTLKFSAYPPDDAERKRQEIWIFHPDRGVSTKQGPGEMDLRGDPVKDGKRLITHYSKSSSKPDSLFLWDSATDSTVTLPRGKAYTAKINHEAGVVVYAGDGAQNSNLVHANLNGDIRRLDLNCDVILDSSISPDGSHVVISCGRYRSWKNPFALRQVLLWDVKSSTPEHLSWLSYVFPHRLELAWSESGETLALVHHIVDREIVPSEPAACIVSIPYFRSYLTFHPVHSRKQTASSN